MVLANASSSNSIAAVRHPCEIASTRRARHHRVYDLILDRHVRGFFRGQRLPVGFPVGDGPRIFPRLIVVRDAREQPAQFDGGQHLATLIEGGADRGGFLLRDNEHACGMGRGPGGPQVERPVSRAWQRASMGWMRRAFSITTASEPSPG
jgi:hypothetical protein